jgi:uroporphyrinogen-III decarboxylase
LAPPIASALAALNDVAPDAAAWSAHETEFFKKMASRGFQTLFSSISLAPFDLLTDFLRGLRGIMLDIYRRPEKLLAAQAKLLPFLVESAVGITKATGNPIVHIPLHRGADGFMSLQQFEDFYWPGLKQLMLSLIDAGAIPFPFYEGTYDKRLEYLRELPKGKVLSWFDRTDLFKAKEIIGDVTCIVGGMPVSLLHSGTSEEIRAHTKQLIETVGKGGGYIMSSSTSFNDVNPKAVKTWFDATREYGSY